MSRAFSRLGGLFRELKRRRVFRAAAVYAAVAFVVVEAAAISLPALLLPSWTVTLVVVLAILGFPVALALAWSFDITLGGVQRTDQVPAAEQKHQVRARDKRRIVVLPFSNIGPSKDDEYFADGMTEELISALARLPSLSVIARTSAMRYKGGGKSVAEIGAELEVGSALEGGIRRAGERLRITVQLVDTESQSHLWSQDYDRDLKDVFAIQRDIASQVAQALEVRLLEGGEQSPGQATKSLEAYDLYLLGRHHWNWRTDEEIRKAIGFFERAIAADPNYAPAHAGLADCHVTLGVYGAEPPTVVMPKAEAAARLALEIDASLVEALTAQGLVKAMYHWDWPAAERDLKRALDLDAQHPLIRQRYALNYLTPQGRFDEAIAEMTQARALDPVSPVIGTSLGVQHYFARDYDRAIAACHATLKAEPEFAMAHFFLGQACLEQGRHDEAIAALDRSVTLAGHSAETVSALARAYAVAGRSSEARAVLGELAERAKGSYIAPTLFAQIHAALGEVDDAFRWLERAVEARATDLVWLKVRPTFDALRPDSRCGVLLQRLGLD